MISFRVSMNEHTDAVTIRAQYTRGRGGAPLQPAFLRPRGGAGPGEDEETPEPADDTPGPALTGEEFVASLDGAVMAPGVLITVEQRIAGNPGLPFCYQIVMPGEHDSIGGNPMISTAVVRIVAAPGVGITLLPPMPGIPVVRIDVLRVQDPSCIPPLGSPIDASLLLLNNGVPMHRNDPAFFASPPGALLGTLDMTDMPVGPERDRMMRDFVSRSRERIDSTRIAVIPQRNGVLIFDNRSQRMLRVHVPSYNRRGAAGSQDHQARFGYFINEAAGNDMAVLVTASHGVAVTQFRYTKFDSGEALNLPPQAQLDRMGSMEPFMLLRVDDFDAVPLPGNDPRPGAGHLSQLMTYEETPTGPSWVRLDGVRITIPRIPFVDVPPDLATLAGRIAFDLAVARIPGVGDAVDLLELVYAASTGRDRWGQRVGLLDLSLMAVGSLLPFVGTPEVRLAGNVALAGGLAATGVEIADELFSPSPLPDPEEG